MTRSMMGMIRNAFHKVETRFFRASSSASSLRLDLEPSMFLPRRSSARSVRTSLVMATALLGATVLIPQPSLHAQRRGDQQTDRSFTWSGTIPAGRRIMIKNINGGIEVERATGNRVEVTAEKRWRRGNPEMVRIEQQKIGDEVLVCALWGEESRCDENGIRSQRNSRWNNNRDNDVSVHFVVRVPEGVRVDVSTVNGGLEVNGVTTEVRANTVNGSVQARSAGGPVRAKTVNGSITVSMGSVSRAEDLEYETVNGSVTIELPSNFGAQLELSTVNGRVTTDFPITISGTISPKRLRGTVGDGSTRLRASTVNGSVTLRRN